MSWLALDSTTDGIFRVLFVFIGMVVIVYYSSLMERPYHNKLAQLYVHPWWRMLLLVLVLSGALWCPRVGVVMAFIAFLYFHDMGTLVMPLPHL
jgi:hypothetical protein